MHIRQVDADQLRADARLAAGVHALEVAAYARDLPTDPPPAARWHLHNLTGTDDGVRLNWLAQDDAGDVLGRASLTLPARDNAHLGSAEIVVHPAHRRHGLGAALLRALVDELAAAGRRTLLVETCEGTPGPAALEALGLVCAQRNQRSVMPTDAVLPAAPLAEGYRIESWTAAVPEPWLERYAAAKDAMNDAPIGSMDWEDMRVDGARVRAYEDLLAAGGRTIRYVVAVHEATGELAALTETGAGPDHPWAEQEDTCVARAHRGRGLGLAVKAAMVRRLRAEAPWVTHVVTWNADDNRFMLAINAALGYQPDGVWCEYQGGVTALAAAAAGRES